MLELRDNAIGIFATRIFNEMFGLVHRIFYILFSPNFIFQEQSIQINFEILQYFHKGSSASTMNLNSPLLTIPNPSPALPLARLLSKSLTEERQQYFPSRISR